MCEALEVLRETLGNRHPKTLNSINNLGHLLKDKGDLAAAEPLYREALEVKLETLGRRHPSTLSSINNLGMLLQAEDDNAAAEPRAATRGAGGAARDARQSSSKDADLHQRRS